jgi:hypothetical protein
VREPRAAARGIVVAWREHGSSLAEAKRGGGERGISSGKRRRDAGSRAASKRPLPRVRLAAVIGGEGPAAHGGRAHRFRSRDAALRSGRDRNGRLGARAESLRCVIAYTVAPSVQADRAPARLTRNPADHREGDGQTGAPRERRTASVAAWRMTRLQARRAEPMMRFEKASRDPGSLSIGSLVRVGPVVMASEVRTAPASRPTSDARPGTSPSLFSRLVSSAIFVSVVERVSGLPRPTRPRRGSSAEFPAASASWRGRGSRRGTRRRRVRRLRARRSCG